MTDNNQLIDLDEVDNEGYARLYSVDIQIQELLFVNTSGR